MPFRYTDEKIPKRPSQGGKGSRSVFGEGRGWRMISQEELFTDSDRNGSDRYVSDTDKDGSDKDLSGRDKSDRFIRLNRMTRRYQVAEEARADSFLEQAALMESYEEEGPVPETEFYHQYTGYQEMDVWELHGYFSWRTHFRRGECVPYQFEYVRLHAAELISLVGVKDRQEAFEQLLRLQALALSEKTQPRRSTGMPLSWIGSQMDRELRSAGTMRRMPGVPEPEMKKLRNILSGFVLVWEASPEMGPAPELLQEYCIPNPEREAENTTLLHYEESSDAALYRVICSLTPNRARSSEFLRQAGEDAWRVIARVFRSVCRKQKQTGAPVLSEQLLGTQRTVQRDLFPMMPYKYNLNGREEVRIEVSAATAYLFKEGRWFRSAYPPMRDEGALRTLQELVRECERVLRKALHYKNQLPDRMKNPVLAKLIGEELREWLNEKEKRMRPEVRVDLSRLDRIRDQAAITRDRLLEGTEEGLEAQELSRSMNDPAPYDHAQTKDAPVIEQETIPEKESVLAKESVLEKESVFEQKMAQGLQPESGQSALPELPVGDEIFNPQERAFLQMLLEGRDARIYFRDHKVLPAVFVDAINEKAFDEIGDSIVEESGGGWQLVEDYAEEIRDLLNQT